VLAPSERAEAEAPDLVGGEDLVVEQEEQHLMVSLSFGSWPSAKRPRDLRICAFAPGAVAPPTRRHSRQRGNATPRQGACAHTALSTDLQFVPVLTSSLPLRTLPQPSGRARLHPARGSFADLRGPHRRSGPVRSPSEPRLASASSERASSMRCPGSGLPDRSSGSGPWPSRRPLARIPARLPSRPPVARSPSPRSPVRGQAVDRRHVCSCRVDAEGWDSTFPRRRVSRSCLGGARSASPGGEKTWSSRRRARNRVQTGTRPQSVRAEKASWRRGAALRGRGKKSQGPNSLGWLGSAGRRRARNRVGAGLAAKPCRSQCRGIAWQSCKTALTRLAWGKQAHQRPRACQLVWSDDVLHRVWRCHDRRGNRHAALLASMEWGAYAQATTSRGKQGGGSPILSVAFRCPSWDWIPCSSALPDPVS